MARAAGSVDGGRARVAAVPRQAATGAARTTWVTSQLAGWRWLVLLIFVTGVFGPEIGIPGATVRSSLTYLVAGAACALLLAQMGRPLRMTLWVWVILFPFLVGFFLKFLIYSYGILSDEYAFTHEPIINSSHADLTEAIVWSAVGFVVFCLTAALCLARSRDVPIPESGIPDPPRVRLLLLITVIGAVVASILPILLGFGQMGQESRTLPFRLDAFITRFRTNLAPTLLLLVLWMADRPGRLKLWYAALAVLISLAAVDTIVRTSRGSLILFALPIVFLFLLTNRLTRGRKAFAGGMVALAIVTFPIVSALRGTRAGGDPEAMRSALTEAAAADPVLAMLFAIDHVATRVQGVEMIDVIVRDRSPVAEGYPGTTFVPGRLPWGISNDPTVTYLTSDIMGLNREIEGRSPTVPGSLLIIGGVDALVLGMIGFTLAVSWAWQRLLRIEASPVALAFFANVLLVYFGEGGLGIQDPIAWTVTIIIISWVYRELVQRPALSGFRAPGYLKST